MAADIRRMVRDQIAEAIEHDIDGGETLMKEVYERLPGKTDEEYRASMTACRDEMRIIVAWLRGPA